MQVLSLFLLALSDLLATAQLAGATGSNETDLLARHGVTAHRGRMADVLVVASAVRVLNGLREGRGGNVGRLAHGRRGEWAMTMFGDTERRARQGMESIESGRTNVRSLIKSH